MMNRVFAAIGANIRAITTAVVYNNVLAGAADGIEKAQKTLDIRYEPAEFEIPEVEEIDPEELLLNVE